MTKNRRTHDEEAWTNAKKLCRLTARQVEMGRALGMNPKKLPRLRPSPQEDWKLPVGEFIEECYWKRFGAPPRTRGQEPSARMPPRFVHACRRKLQSGLCQNCVRHRLKRRSNTAIYGDTPMHIGVARSC
jgi:hypothetical protein